MLIKQHKIAIKKVEELVKPHHIVEDLDLTVLLLFFFLKV